MIFRYFAVQLAARLVLLWMVMFILVWLSLRGGHVVGLLLGAVVFLLLVAEVWRYVNRTNREVGRFLESVRHSDFLQRFSYDETSTGFDELGRELTLIVEKLRARSIDHEAEVRKLRALIEHVPVPLLTLHSDAAITLQNSAARRLFGAAHVTHLRDLRKFGAGFSEAVEDAAPGERELVQFSVEGVDYQLTLAATEVVVAGRSERLISLQDIQSELDATQAEAWQDLVSVLTHEIINSISPVTSLAASASDVVDDVVSKVRDGSPVAEDLVDLQEAVSIVARRSESLTHFVDGYRQISKLAPVEKKRVHIGDLFSDVIRLARTEWDSSQDISVESAVAPPDLDVYADRDLIEPVLLNLLRNSRHATSSAERPTILLSASLNRRGNVIFEVIDNGEGVDPANVRKIFVPFFTTREGGSGVGLALARQVMTAHGGFIQVADRKGGGAIFRMTF